MTVSLGPDQWYEDYVSRKQGEFGFNTSDDARAIATAIMTAGVVVAQAIDNSLGPDVPNADYTGSIKEQLNQLTKTLRRGFYSLQEDD